MSENLRGFWAFLRSMDWRVFQEREIGLDIYLSGITAWIPLALAVASATVFLLAIFQWIPLRRHSIPVLLGAGALALAVGLLGTWIAYRAHLAENAPPARVVAEGKGGTPAEKPGQVEALLSIPCLLGSITLGADVGGSLFLLAFWGGAGKKGKGKAGG
jgi:hypothetical protein